MSAQLENFRAYIGRLKSVVGEAGANSIISNALFLISAGNNDVAFTFNTLKIAMPFPLYTNQLIGWNNAFLQGLYQLGARKVWALSTLPLGCLPAGRTTAGGPLRVCAEAANGEARIFNAQLASSLQSLQSTLPGSSLRFIDVFTPFLNIIQNPVASGFVNAANGCCGTGTYEVAETCNMLVPSCPNPASYVFWDAAHPSQAAYERVVASILSSKPKLNNYNASTYY
ncbi:GDSL esterase/lipase [Arachis hypogaea]|nr:GDSL esterase/lipase [Arachis hypogaea]